MIVVDTELTGLDTEKDSLLSIGAVDLENPQNQFYGECRIWPGAHVNPVALEINGFSEKEIQDPKKQTDGELIASFIAWALTCNEHTLAGQNPYWDMAFMRNAAKRYHLDWPFAHRTIDQHSLAYMHTVKQGIVPPVTNKRTDLDSDRIMEYVGIPVEPHPHNALNGAKQAAEAISRMLYGKNLLPEFAKYKIPWL
jgi:DNA polymerase III epsilon subunit-like protein